jgi:oligopeptide/dipeptide ABC transporter ATP-binding protein
MGCKTASTRAAPAGDAMNDSTLFRIRGLTIEAVTLLARRRLVESLDLDVQAGEIYGVVGETGSGKSISMMASVGLTNRGLQVTAGSVTFAGEEVDARQQRRLRHNLAHGVSLLFQNAKGALNPFMRTAKQVERVLRVNRVPPAEQPARVRELFLAVGLDPDEIGPKYAHEISGGQAQRVAMACCLATNPRLLIADEPTTALDVTTEREVLRFLRELCQQRNMAMILIAHNLALVSEHCSRLSILHAGHVVETGTVEGIFSEPLHPYTRGLLAAIPDVDEPHDLQPLMGSVWGGPSIKNRCRFSHRCPQARDLCNQRIPEMVRFNEHWVRCVLYDDGLYDGAMATE